MRNQACTSPLRKATLTLPVSSVKWCALNLKRFWRRTNTEWITFIQLVWVVALTSFGCFCHYLKRWIATPLLRQMSTDALLCGSLPEKDTWKLFENFYPFFPASILRVSSQERQTARTPLWPQHSSATRRPCENSSPSSKTSIPPASSRLTMTVTTPAKT